MARALKKRGRKRPDDDPEEEEDEREERPPTQEESDARESDASVGRALEDVPMRPIAKLFRIDRLTGREAYLDTIDAELFTQDFIREQYGGGDYRVQFRGPVGKGRIKSNRGEDRFSIDKAIPAKFPGVVTGPITTPTTAPGGAPLGGVLDSAMLSALQMITTMQTGMAKVMVEIMHGGGKKDGGGDREILLALLERDRPNNLRELLELNKFMNGGAAGGNAGPRSVAGLLEDLEAYDALRERFGGGGDSHRE